jgi:stalled ribosome rescue protein Dom34
LGKLRTNITTKGDECFKSRRRKEGRKEGRKEVEIMEINVELTKMEWEEFVKRWKGTAWC